MSELDNMQCPHCGHVATGEWINMSIDFDFGADDPVENEYWECPNCGENMVEGQ